MLIKQRILPIMLLLLLIVPVILSACSLDAPKTTQPIKETQTQEKTETPSASSSVPATTLSAADSYLNALEKKDFGGKEFRIAAYQTKNIFPSSSGDIIDDLALQRNQKVEERYQVKLVQASLNGTDFFESLRTDYESGIASAELVVAPVDMLDRFVTYSMYADVNTLGIDFTAPYYDQQAMAGLSTGVITYAVVGDFTASPENSHCVFYNKNAVEKNGLGDIPTMVREGTWTWSTLIDFSSRATGKNAAYKMSYGISTSCSSAEFIRLLWASTDVPFFSNQPPYNPALDIETATANTIIRTIKNVRNSPGYYGDKNDGMSAISSFQYGSTLFYISEISDYANLLNPEFNIGFAPLPKYDVNQVEYSSYTDNSFQAAYVLENCADKEMAGVILNALSAASYRLIDDAYLSLYMHMYLSSNEEGLMLKSIIDHPYYEIGYLLGDVYNQFASASTDMIYRVVTAGVNFRDTYKQNEKQFRRFLTNKIFYYPKPSTTAPATTVATVAPVTTQAPVGTVSPVVKPTAPNTTAKLPAVTVPPKTTVKIPVPTTVKPVVGPTAKPTVKPSLPPATVKPTAAVTTAKPTVPVATTTAPVTAAPTATVAPTTAIPTTSVPATAAPTSVVVTSSAPATSSTAAQSSPLTSAAATSAS